MASIWERFLPHIPGKTKEETREWVRRVLSGKPGDRRLTKVKDLKNKPKQVQ